MLRAVRSALGAAIVVALNAASSLAQFVVPIPRALPDSVAQTDELRGRFERFMPSGLRGTLREVRSERRTSFRGAAVHTTPAAREAVRTALLEQGQEFCRIHRPSDVDRCIASLAVDVTASSGDPTPSSSYLILGPSKGRPFVQSRAAVVSMLRSTSSQPDDNVFSKFAANFSDNEAFVATDVISGLAGRLLFALNYVNVLVKSDTADPIVGDTIESNTASALRMLQNGGTLTLRLGAPFHARTGPTFRDASMFYVNLGFTGPIGRTDSLAASGALTAEYAMAVRIRDFSEAASVLGDLVAAVRVGHAHSGRQIVTNLDQQGFGYGQLAIGLKQGESMTLAALMTWPFDPAFRQLLPRLILSFSALR